MVWSGLWLAVITRNATSTPQARSIARDERIPTQLWDLGFTVTENDYTAQADVECLRDCYKALRHLRRTGYVAADQLEEAMR